MQSINDNVYVLVIVAMLGTVLLVVSFVLLLFRNQHKLLQQKEKLQAAEIEHQKQLLRTVIESQEAERQRIGRDLHDDVGTALSGLRMTIDRFALQRNGQAPLDQLTTNSKTIIDNIIVHVRNISHNLSPEIMNINTPSEAVEELCAMINELNRISVSLCNQAAPVLDAFDLTTALVVYRVLEELINNTIKHAGANAIVISISQANNQLIIDYRDNGIGMPPAAAIKKGRGLQNIESRLSIVRGESTDAPAPPGSGYHIQINIPLLN